MFYNDRQRYEIFLGIFRKNTWTCSSLCNYFQRLIPKCSIQHCQIISSSNPIHKNYCFAILTFDSISIVDQCLQKRNQIKNDIHLLVKRNLANSPKSQRPISEYISIHMKSFDEQFNRNNLVNYFEKYGFIRCWKIIDSDRKILLHFDDYDSVDRIFLDKPHFLNHQLINFEKYFPSIEENFLEKQTHLLDIIQIYIHLKQDLDLLNQTNNQLKNNIKQRTNQNRNILHEYYQQIQLQRFINISLQELISRNSRFNKNHFLKN